jgi:hypothetical protein
MIIYMLLFIILCFILFQGAYLTIMICGILAYTAYESIVPISPQDGKSGDAAAVSGDSNTPNASDTRESGVTAVQNPLSNEVKRTSEVEMAGVS